jgi:acyl carrier protein
MERDMMKIKQRMFELVEQLTEQQIDEKDMDKPLTNLGVDSLTALELAVYLEREFGYRLSEDELAQIQTLQDILEIIRKKGM